MVPSKNALHNFGWRSGRQRGGGFATPINFTKGEGATDPGNYRYITKLRVMQELVLVIAGERHQQLIKGVPGV